MRHKCSILVITCAILSIAPISFTSPDSGQAPGAERVFNRPKAEVEKALQELHPTLNGRLPILEGFAAESNESWDRISRGYYECSVQLVADAPDQTRAHVTAKITAWYSDPAPSKSGYRVLRSSGRVEADVLDRLEEALDAKSRDSAATSSQTSADKPGSSMRVWQMPPSWKIRPETTGPNFGSGSTVAVHGSGVASPSLPVSSEPAVAASRASSEEIESLRHRREAAEKELAQRNSDVQNLEEILRNQSHPADIAVVRRNGAKVFSRPSSSGSVLFSAEQDDEFQALEIEPEWVHIQISGVSRGWIRRSELTLPEGLLQNLKRAETPTSEDESAFKFVREETNSYKGGWESLNGKQVKIIWAAPASAVAKPAAPAEMRNFARSLFTNALREIAPDDQQVAGIVIVFDSADGGQVATTIQTLRQWQGGGLPEASFWKLCSVEPPELFDR